MGKLTDDGLLSPEQLAEIPRYSDRHHLSLELRGHWPAGALGWTSRSVPRERRPQVARFAGEGPLEGIMTPNAAPARYRHPDRMPELVIPTEPHRVGSMLWLSDEHAERPTCLSTESAHCAVSARVRRNPARSGSGDPGHPERASCGDLTHPAVSGMSALSAAAAALAANGWPVFPAHGKVPLTEHGHKDGTTDAHQVAQWWRRWPNANVATRVPDSLIVVDVDPRADGHLTLAALEAEHGCLPATLTVKTGGHELGRHLYFLRPPGALSNGAGKLGPGLDVKLAGKGYTILPPSVHPEMGRPYEWLDVETPVARYARVADVTPAATSTAAGTVKTGSPLRRRPPGRPSGGGSHLGADPRASRMDPRAIEGRGRVLVPTWQVRRDQRHDKRRAPVRLLELGAAVRAGHCLHKVRGLGNAHIAEATSAKRLAGFAGVQHDAAAASPARR